MFWRGFGVREAVKLWCSIHVGFAADTVGGAEECENISFTNDKRRVGLHRRGPRSSTVETASSVPEGEDDKYFCNANAVNRR
jgi:hypothetical protein